MVLVDTDRSRRDRCRVFETEGMEFNKREAQKQTTGY